MKTQRAHALHTHGGVSADDMAHDFGLHLASASDPVRCRFRDRGEGQELRRAARN